MLVDLILDNAKAYMKGELVECSLAINEGRIFKIGKETNMPHADEEIDLKNLLVLPGLIDAHVHLRDEGKAYKEDFHSGTAAAAAGGITTVLDMPNNDPVTMSSASLRNRMNKAEDKILVNVGFLSEFPKNMAEIERIIGEGSVAFKLFMAEQVGGLNINDDAALLEAFKKANEFSVPVAVHAEDNVMLKNNEEKLKHTEHNDIEAFLKAHTEDVEAKAVKRMLNIAKQTGINIHFCHVTTENALKAIAESRRNGVRATCETTPHNLFLSTEDLKRIGTLALTMPPVRDKRQIAALWEGIGNYSVDIVGSDHAPHTLEEKHAESIWKVKVGIPGLETTLPLLLTEVGRGKLSIGDVVRLMAEKPVEIYSLKDRGYLKTGNHADLTIVDLKKRYKIDSSKFKSKAKYSPFDGWNVEGKPAQTLVNGQLVLDEGNIVAKAGTGEIIRRT